MHIYIYIYIYILYTYIYIYIYSRQAHYEVPDHASDGFRSILQAASDHGHRSLFVFLEVCCACVAGYPRSVASHGSALIIGLRLMLLPAVAASWIVGVDFGRLIV